jgi:hypothetical protein
MPKRRTEANTSAPLPASKKVRNDEASSVAVSAENTETEATNGIQVDGVVDGKIVDTNITITRTTRKSTVTLKWEILPTPHLKNMDELMDNYNMEEDLAHALTCYDSTIKTTRRDYAAQMKHLKSKDVAEDLALKVAQLETRPLPFTSKNALFLPFRCMVCKEWSMSEIKGKARSVTACDLCNQQISSTKVECNGNKWEIVPQPHLKKKGELMDNYNIEEGLALALSEYDASIQPGKGNLAAKDRYAAQINHLKSKSVAEDLAVKVAQLETRPLPFPSKTTLYLPFRCVDCEKWSMSRIQGKASKGNGCDSCKQEQMEMITSTKVECNGNEWEILPEAHTKTKEELMEHYGMHKQADMAWALTCYDPSIKTTQRDYAAQKEHLKSKGVAEKLAKAVAQFGNKTVAYSFEELTLFTFPMCGLREMVHV